MDSQRLTIAELASLCQVGTRQVRQWIASGLPWHSDRGRGRRFEARHGYFDSAEVSTWLVQHGLAQPPAERPVIKSVKELAQYLGIVQQRVYQLIDAGLPRELDGSFDADKVEAWRAARHAETEASSETSKVRQQHEAELARLKVEDAQLDLDRKRGLLIEIELSQRIVTRYTREVQAHLEQIPEFALTLLSESATAREKRQMRDGLARRIDSLRGILSDCLRDWAQRVRGGEEIT